MTKTKIAVGYFALFLSVVAVATGAFTILVANPAALRSEETSRLLD